MSSAWLNWFLKDAIYITPEPINVVGREISQRAQELFLGNYPYADQPLVGPEGNKFYQKWWWDKSINQPKWLSAAEKELRATPLSDNIREIQKRYFIDIDKLGNNPPKGLVNAAIEGAKAFRAPTTIGEMMDVLADAHRPLIAQIATTRVYQNPAEAWSDAYEALVSLALPTFRGRRTSSGAVESFTNYYGHKLFGFLQRSGRIEEAASPPGVMSLEKLFHLPDTSATDVNDFHTPLYPQPSVLPTSGTVAELTPAEKAADLAKRVFRVFPKWSDTGLTAGRIANLSAREVLFLTGNAQPEHIKDSPLLRHLLPGAFPNFDPMNPMRNDPYGPERSIARELWRNVAASVTARPQISSDFGPGQADVEHYDVNLNPYMGQTADFVWDAQQQKWVSAWERGGVWKRGTQVKDAFIYPFAPGQTSSSPPPIYDPGPMPAHPLGRVLRERLRDKFGNLPKESRFAPYRPIEYDFGQARWDLNRELTEQEQMLATIEARAGIDPTMDAIGRTVNTGANFVKLARRNPLSQALYNIGMSIVYPGWTPENRHISLTPQGTEMWTMPEDAITEFRGEYGFMSNFYPSAHKVYVDPFSSGDPLQVPTTEHAFQVSKTLNPKERWQVGLARTAAEAKKMGRGVTLDPEYMEGRVNQMSILLREKFKDPYLANKLLATGNREIIEGNTWGDTFWGMVQDEKTGQWRGKNVLGRLLMEMRYELATVGQPDDWRPDSQMPGDYNENAIVPLYGRHQRRRGPFPDYVPGETPRPVIPADKLVQAGAPNAEQISINPGELKDPRPGAFRAREFVPARFDPWDPDENPTGMLSARQAFRYNPTGRGTARDNVGYIRGTRPDGTPFTYLTESELRQKYDGLQLFQKGYLNQKSAGFHEIGHVVWRALPQEARDKFTEIFEARLKAVGKEGMLAGDWPDERFNLREEFSQAYSAAATYGGEMLGEEISEYATFFEQYKYAIEKGEELSTLVTHFGEPLAFKPKVATQVHLGDIGWMGMGRYNFKSGSHQMPQNYWYSATWKPGREGHERKYRGFENLRRYLDMTAGRDVTARQQVYGEMVSNLKTDMLMEGDPMPQGGQPSRILYTASTEAEGLQAMRAMQEVGMIEGVSVIDRGLQRVTLDEQGQDLANPYYNVMGATREWKSKRGERFNQLYASEQRLLKEEAKMWRAKTRTSSNAPFTDAELRSAVVDKTRDRFLGTRPGEINMSTGEMIDSETADLTRAGGDIVLSSSQVQEAYANTQSAILGAVNSPVSGSPKEMMASLISRFNKAINETYNNAIKEGMPIAQQIATNNMRKLSQEIGGGILKSVATKLAPNELNFYGEAAGAAQGWRNRITPEEVPAFLRNNPKLADALLTEGIDPTQLARSPYPSIRQNDRGDYVQFGGGPGGPGGGGFVAAGGAGGGGRSIFGGRAGAVMYAAYIGKRMMGMTIEPELQNAQQYGQYLSQFASMQAVTDPSIPLTSTPAGFAARARATQRYWQRGSYEMWGGFSDAAYAMTGGDTSLARAKSAAVTALGVGAGGLIAGQAIGMVGAMMGPGGAIAGATGATGALAGASTLGTIGGILSTAAVPASIVAGGTMGLMELYNYIAQPDVPVTPGNTWRELNRWWSRTEAASRARRGEGIRGRVPQEIYQKYMTPQQIALDEYQYEETPEVRAARIQAEAIEAATGMEAEQTIGALTGLQTVLRGGLPQDMATITKQWQSVGLDVNAGVQTFGTIAGQLGYLPQTADYDAEFQRFINVTATGDPAALAKYQAHASRVAQFSGQIAPYFTSSSEAARLTNIADLTTAAAMGPVQALMGVATQGGLDMSTVIGYRVSGYESQRQLHVSPGVTRGVGPQVPVLEETTLGSHLTAQAKVRGAYSTYNVDLPLANTLMGMGQDPVSALQAGMNLGFTNAQQAQSAAAWLRMGSSYGFGYGSPEQYVSPIADISNFAAAAIPRMAEPLLREGYGNAMDVLAQGLGQNLSNTQIALVGAGMGGDMGAMSYMANTQPELLRNPATWNFFNQAGQPIWRTDYGAFGRLVSSRAGGLFQAGLVPAGGLSEGPLTNLMMMGGQGTDLQRTQAILGSTGIDQEMMQAFSVSGESAAALHRSRMAGFQRQSAGIAMAGVNLARQFLWGGGDWRNPTEDSIWGIQDRMRSLQHRQQMYQFGFSREMMDTQNQFAIQQEQIQGARMETSQAFQRWQMGFQQQGAMMQRGWAREDWQYQDQMRGMTFGWAMEDIEEAIRTSSGRQRSQYVRQRERMTTKYNLEGQQVDTVRERQEEVWAREDERFEKQQTYAETMMELDEEQFELQQTQRETMFEMQSEHLQKQIEFYKESKKLQDEMTEKQREYQVEQLNLQAAAAAVQAEAAKEQETYNTAVAVTEEIYGKTKGHAETIMKYDPTAVFKAFSDMVLEIDKLEKSKIDSLAQMAVEMDDVDWGQLDRYIALFNTISSLDPDKVTRYTSALIGLEAEIIDLIDGPG